MLKVHKYKIIIFACIPLNPAYLLNNKCKINKKDQYLHYFNKIYLNNTDKKC